MGLNLMDVLKINKIGTQVKYHLLIGKNYNNCCNFLIVSSGYSSDKYLRISPPTSNAKPNILTTNNLS